MALLRCVAALDEMKLAGDQGVGVTIVTRAFEDPIRQIVINAGVEAAVIVQEVKKKIVRGGSDVKAEGGSKS